MTLWKQYLVTFSFKTEEHCVISVNCPLIYLLLLVGNSAYEKYEESEMFP